MDEQKGNDPLLNGGVWDFLKFEVRDKSTSRFAGEIFRRLHRRARQFPPWVSRIVRNSRTKLVPAEQRNDEEQRSQSRHDASEHIQS